MKKIILAIMILSFAMLVGCTGKGEVNNNMGIQKELDAAQELFDDEEYEDSLKAYLDLMSEKPKNKDARLGVIRCQMELGNYQMAITNIDMLLQIDPQVTEAYELYLEVGERQDSIYVMLEAIRLAEQNEVEEILAKVPETPVIHLDGEYFNEAINVEITCEDEDAEIYYTMYNDLINSNGVQEYDKPIYIAGGSGSIEAFVIKDGYPSQMVYMPYIIETTGQVVTFADPLVEQSVRDSLGYYMGEPITDLDCWRMTYLSIYNTYDENYNEITATTLSDLEKFPNLYNLNISGMSPNLDYTIIENCKSLSTLEIYRCNLSDISFMESMDSLRYVYLQGNQIKDFSALKDKNIEGLYITNNPGSDVTDLVSNMPTLMYLEVNTSQVSDFRALQSSNLTNLNVYRDTNDIDLEGIGCISSLLSLYISTSNDNYNESYEYLIAKDTKPLTKLTNLNNLSIYGIQDANMVNNVMNLKNLTDLSIGSCGIQDPEAAMAQISGALPNCYVYVY